MTFPDHFSRVAGQYASNRPRYPDALFTWLASVVPSHGLAWDAGCGSGQASTALAAHFERVVATDASGEQLAAAERHVRVRYAEARELNPELANGSVDLVTVAQAVHWFDRPLFWAEAQRVLAPDGVLAVWTYGVAEITPDVDAVIAPFYGDLLGLYWPPERSHCDTHYRDIGFPYPTLPGPAFEMTVTWSRAQLLGYLRTWSAVGQYLRREGVDPVLELEPALEAVWPDQVERTVRWPLTVLAGRPQR
jgi:SAM-dependent methyltransferase